MIKPDHFRKLGIGLHVLTFVRPAALYDVFGVSFVIWRRSPTALHHLPKRDNLVAQLRADTIVPIPQDYLLLVAADENRPKEGILQQPIEADTTVIELVNGERFPGAQDGGFCKVEGEWIRYTERVGDELRGCRRGQRGTRAVPHQASSAVRVGRTVQFTIAFPHAKDDWNG